MTAMPVYGEMGQDELDREYSPSSRAPNFLATLERYAHESAQARRSLKHFSDVSYGPSAAEYLDFFPPVRTPAPLFAFVHGGHWQESSKEDSCFAAPAFIEAGASFVGLGYGLAPEHELASMVESVRTALRWLRTHAAELGTRPESIHLGGSSAGAHLVAAALCDGAGGEPPVASLTLLSGVYDLEPVRLSYVNRKLRLDRSDAAAHSPLHQLPCAAERVILARGAEETAEYARQHQMFAAALACGGPAPLDLVIAGRDHFDLPLDLARQGTALGDAVLTQLALLPHAVGDFP